MRLWPLIVSIVGVLCLVVAIGHADEVDSMKLEADLMKSYNRKHRPVRSDSTTTNVTILISITHIERVNEDEQTAIIHGSMYASWTDEYLKWEPKEYNETSTISLEAYKIWQPALSLYNSARGNQWNLYLGTSPSSIGYMGKVVSHGSFSFHVTCQFSFVDWPSDEHKCPIVIADWVYDLSRVNLSESMSDQVMSPYINLHYDPFDSRQKKHVAGWEVTATSRKHCYWGRQWCIDSLKDTDSPELFWSVLVFDVSIRRHAPYIIFTLVVPTILSSFINLLAFWIENRNYPLMLLMFNTIFQGLYGWDMIRQLPAGDGNMPDMVYYYGFNMTMTMMAIILHAFLDWVSLVSQNSTEMPESVRDLFSQLRSFTFFTHKGISFDPHELYGGSSSYEKPTAEDRPSSITTPSATALGVFDNVNEEQSSCTTGNLLEEDVPLMEVDQSKTSSGDSIVVVEREETNQVEAVKYSIDDHVLLIRRLAFCFFAVFYLWELPSAFIF